MKTLTTILMASLSMAAGAVERTEVDFSACDGDTLRFRKARAKRAAAYLLEFE